MAWSVRLQDETGKPILDDGGVEFEIIPHDGDFKLLGYIDRYGDTYFNQLQMNDFLNDWDTLRPNAFQRRQWQLVRDLALKCRAEAPVSTVCRRLMIGEMYGPPSNCKRFEEVRKDSPRKCIRPLRGESLSPGT